LHSVNFKEDDNAQQPPMSTLNPSREISCISKTHFMTLVGWSLMYLFSTPPHHSTTVLQPICLQAGCPSCHPTNSVKALKATSTFGLGRRR